MLVFSSDSVPIKKSIQFQSRVFSSNQAGTVFGTRDNSPNTVSVPEMMAPTISSVPTKTPTQTPRVAPLNNSIREEAHTIALGDATLVEASLENSIKQVFVNRKFPFQPSDSQLGLWCNVRG